MRSHIPLKEYLEGTPVVPRLLMADAYTIGSGPHVCSDAKQHSVYHITPRRGLQNFMPEGVAEDGRLVFAGLRRIVRDLFSEPISHYEIDLALEFLKTAHAGGTVYRMDEQMWRRVVDDYNGYPPIMIEAFLEGTVVFPQEPVIQVTADNGFGELAVWFESKLVQVWSSIERVTAAKWFKEFLRKRCVELHPNWTRDQIESSINIMLHDFGDRAGSCAQESEVLGSAHLLVFPGSDTFAAGYLDWQENGKTPYANSIHALAHRTVTGHVNEYDAHDTLYDLGKSTGITAHVSDTNDFKVMVDRITDRMANGEWKDDSNVVVIRSDSGNPIDNINYVLYKCTRLGLYTEDENGVKSATCVRWLESNGLSWHDAVELVEYVIDCGWSPFASGGFGIGGGLRDSINRGHTGLSMKLAEVHGRQVCKKSAEVVKRSIPGAVSVIPGNPSVVPVSDNTANMLKVWYDGRYKDSDLTQIFRAPCLETSHVVRNRIAGSFWNRSESEDPISDSIRQKQEEIYIEQSDILKEEWR